MGIERAGSIPDRDGSLTPAVRLPGFLGLIRREVVAAEIRDGELAKDVVEDRARACDSLVAFDEAGGVEAGRREGIHEFLERHAKCCRPSVWARTRGSPTSPGQPLFISAERRLPANPAFASMRTTARRRHPVPIDPTAGLEVLRTLQGGTVNVASGQEAGVA